jgi:hypothetical protein
MSVNVDSNGNEADFGTIFEKIQPPPMFVVCVIAGFLQLSTYCAIHLK